ncbi:hypothetical protein JXB27_04275 [Candidatus Woesearchaeota archaeon]|nr:hypothetical protein [Candidatus Woesearchaeota archaeon]
MPKNNVVIIPEYMYSFMILLPKDSDKWVLPSLNLDQNTTAEDAVKRFSEEFGIPYEGINIGRRILGDKGLEAICITPFVGAGDYRSHEFANKCNLLKKDMSYDYSSVKTADITEAMNLLTPEHAELIKARYPELAVNYKNP